MTLGKFKVFNIKEGGALCFEYLKRHGNCMYHLN
jgi:hypothetical protein